MSRPVPPHFSLKRPKKAGKKFHIFHFPITVFAKVGRNVTFLLGLVSGSVHRTTGSAEPPNLTEPLFCRTYRTERSV